MKGIRRIASQPHFRDGIFYRPNGLHWITASILVIGELVGGGLVTLPIAGVQTNIYVAIFLTIFIVLTFSYTSHLLAQCWTMLIERYPQYMKHCRKPYAEIGRRAVGDRCASLVSICIDLSQFGTAVVYFLLCAKNIHNFLRLTFDWDVGQCTMVVILAIVLLPITFLKSPEDFWAAMVVSMMTSVSAGVLIIVGSLMDYEVCSAEKRQPEFHLSNYFLAIGTFLFSYGGLVAFPTIQHDMRKPSEFSKSAVLGFTGASLLYGPASIIGYIAYGDSVRYSIIPSIQIPLIQHAVALMITIHCILTLTIVCNPLNQDIEEVFRIPQYFGRQRVIIRSAVMLAIIIVALTVPNFGPIVDLIGGSTLTLTSMVFPCIFFPILNATKPSLDYDQNDENKPLWQRIIYKNSPMNLILCISIAGCGLVFGGAATFSALRALSSTHFIPPCYLQPFLKTVENAEAMGVTHCCGAWQNITRDESVICAAGEFNNF